jgi:CBS domain-containing protein
VNKNLHDTGYHYCRGDVMARNPKWTQSLGHWKKQFTGWINNSNPEAIMEANIFFDFRSVYGDEDLIRELREHVNATSENKAVFFYHMAQSVLKIKPPLNIFGNIVGDDSETDELSLDSKKILFPVISFLRLYALKEKINETNSMERAGLLHSGKIIDNGTYGEITQAWSFTTMLRLRSQVHSIIQNEAPGNMINLKELSRIEQSTLKKIFSGVSELQTRVGFDFKGAET